MNIEGVVAHHTGDEICHGNCCRSKRPHIYGASMEGVDGSGVGWLHDIAYRLPAGTRVRVTVEVLL